MLNLTITLFGSSIMEGRHGDIAPAVRWYNQLQRQLSERFPLVCFPIYNAAIGGESTRECMARFARDVVATRPDFCLVMVGANNHDCNRPERILADGELEALMVQLAAGLPASCQPVGVILNRVINAWHFATHAPAYQAWLSRYGGLDEALEPERDAFRSFIRQQGWPSLDLCQLMAADPARYIMPEDGIHLNSEGHTLFASGMFELLVPLVGERLDKPR